LVVLGPWGLGSTQHHAPPQDPGAGAGGFTGAGAGAAAAAAGSSYSLRMAHGAPRRPADLQLAVASVLCSV
jgi:hypothetical protein